MFSKINLLSLQPIKQNGKNFYESKIITESVKEIFSVSVQKVNENAYQFNNNYLLKYVAVMEGKILNSIMSKAPSWFNIKDESKLFALFRTNINNNIIKCKVANEQLNMISVKCDKVIFEKDGFYIDIIIDGIENDCKENDINDDYIFNDDSDES